MPALATLPRLSDWFAREITSENLRGLVTTQAVIASEAKQSPCRKEEIASSQKTLLAMTWAEQLRGLDRIPTRRQTNARKN